MNGSQTHTDRKETFWGRIWKGQVITGSFFTRYWLQIGVLLMMVILYINNRYSCQRSMEQIRRLNTRLEVVQTESMRVRGAYMSRIRESAMRHALDSLGLSLSVQNQPPYHLSINASEEEKN